jgi:organic radical activating enzyme
MRQGMNDGLGIQGQVGLSGPVRLDLMFDISCNLACRTCNVESSTYWQKHLKQHGEWDKPIFTPKSKFEVIAALKNLDLSNLKMLVFCGGETLLGQEYWDVADWVVNSVPNAKDNLILCFQTNGTQPILEKNFHIVDKVKLVKLHISLDGVGPVFEYLRWPASWQQVCDNIAQLKETLPSNVMFHVEETISVLNLAYQGELDSWVQQNFSSSKYNDPVEHTKHLAGGIFSLQNCSEEYYAEISRTQYKSLLPLKFQENKKNIEKMIAQIKKIDSYRDQDLKIFLPEVAKFYQRFI